MYLSLVITDGLVLGLDGSVIVTSDRRKTVSDYSSLCGVAVLDGSFQKRLERNQSIKLNRLSEEEMTRCITEGAASPKEWKGRYDSAKARLLTKLSFDVCNEYLEDVKYWLEQTAVHPKQKSTCLRVLYYTVACFLVCLDYVTRNVPLQEPEARKN